MLEEMPLTVMQRLWF